jgi:hypothetical protein
LGNSASFLTITHTTLSAKRFRKYKILTIDVAAVFCFWTEQRRNGSSISRLRLAETQEVLNTVLEAICELRQSETRSVAKTTFLADHTYIYKTCFWRNFVMTSPETSHTKNVTNELIFPLVTDTAHFNIRFGCYGILKSCFSSRHVMDRLDCSCSVRFLGHKMGETC